MTSEKQDIYLRAHTVVIDKPKETRKGSHRPRATKEHPKWAKWALVLDCETRTDVRQELTFGFYRVLQLVGDDGDDGCTYKLVEEGAFYDDDLRADERAILESYPRSQEPRARWWTLQGRHTRTPSAYPHRRW